jgi:hypothetical protein
VTTVGCHRASARYWRYHITSTSASRMPTDPPAHAPGLRVRIRITRSLDGGQFQDQRRLCPRGSELGEAQDLP